jgi:hypothetical protein
MTRHIRTLLHKLFTVAVLTVITLSVVISIIVVITILN